MKKLLVLMFISCTIFSLFACSGSGGANYAIVGTVTALDGESITVVGTEGDAAGVSYRVLLNDKTSYEKNGKSVDSSSLAEGVSVTVTYNGMATRSIPAQINAIKVAINDGGDAHTMNATVKSVDGGTLRVEVTDAEYAYGEYVVHVSKETVILSASGEYIGVSDINVGDALYIVYGGQVTLSLPPQISAMKIRIN